MLGVNGICVIGHGSSTPKSVCNGIRVASDMISFGANDKIISKVNQLKILLDK